MHQNRQIYTLSEYQKKLRNSYKKLGLYLRENETNKIFIFRPVPNCPWLPESRKKYFRKLRTRLSSRFCAWICYDTPSRRTARERKKACDGGARASPFPFVKDSSLSSTSSRPSPKQLVYKLEHTVII